MLSLLLLNERDETYRAYDYFSIFWDSFCQEIGNVFYSLLCLYSQNHYRIEMKCWDLLIQWKLIKCTGYALGLTGKFTKSEVLFMWSTFHMWSENDGYPGVWRLLILAHPNLDVNRPVAGARLLGSGRFCHALYMAKRHNKRRIYKIPLPSLRAWLNRSRCIQT